MRTNLCAIMLVALLSAGCVTTRHAAPPPPRPQNYSSPSTEGIPMRRVAVLPLFSEKYSGEYLRDLDTAFSAELTKKNFFEVVSVSRSQMEEFFGARQLSSVGNLPAETLQKLQRELGVEGVVFTDVTQFSPYRPVSIGVRAKLVDAVTGEIRWAFDYIYDSGNNSVAEAAKRYQLACSNEHQPLTNDGGSILLSPSRFAKYVAADTYANLPAK